MQFVTNKTVAFNVHLFANFRTETYSYMGFLFNQPIFSLNTEKVHIWELLQDFFTSWMPFVSVKK